MAVPLASGAVLPPGNQTFYSDIVTLPAVRYTLIVLHLIVIVLAAAGNGFLIYFIIKHRKQTRRNVTACLVLNLAICDFLNTVAHQPLRLIDLLRPSGSLGDTAIFCQVGGFFTCYLATATFLTIVAIAVERWLLICHPLRAKSWLTIRITRAVLITIWTLSFVTVLPYPILFHYSITIPLEIGNVTFCLIDVFSTDKQGQGYFIFLFFMYYAVPVCVITAAYSSVFRVLYARGINRDSKDESVMRVMQTRKSLAKMMLFIAALFAICEGPYFFTFLLLSVGVKVKRNPIFILMIIEFIPMISAVLNPIVYSLKAKTFRKGMTGTSSSSLQRRSTFRSDTPLKPIESLSGQGEEDKKKKTTAISKYFSSARTSVRYQHVDQTPDIKTSEVHPDVGLTINTDSSIIKPKNTFCEDRYSATNISHLGTHLTVQISKNGDALGEGQPYIRNCFAASSHKEIVPISVHGSHEMCFGGNSLHRELISPKSRSTTNQATPQDISGMVGNKCTLHSLREKTQHPNLMTQRKLTNEGCDVDKLCLKNNSVPFTKAGDTRDKTIKEPNVYYKNATPVTSNILVPSTSQPCHRGSARYDTNSTCRKRIDTHTADAEAVAASYKKPTAIKKKIPVKAYRADFQDNPQQLISVSERTSRQVIKHASQNFDVNDKLSAYKAQMFGNVTAV